jgi:hypothetical protein
MNDNKAPLRDDEFDIEILAQKLSRISRKAIYKLFYPFRVLLINPKRLLLIMIIAAAAAVVGRYTIPAFYKTSFIIRPGNPIENSYLNMLGDLQVMLKDDNYHDIAERLGLNEEVCENLVRVYINPVFKNPFRRDSIIMVDVSLLLKDPRLVDTFQKSIVNTFLNHSPYYTKLQSVKEQELYALEARLISDLKENDSLKKVVTSNAFPRTGGGFVYGEPIDPLKIYESGFRLYSNLVNIQMQKQFITSFELIKPGVVRTKPWFPRIIILLPATIFLGLIVCFVLNSRDQKKYADSRMA